MLMKIYGLEVERIVFVIPNFTEIEILRNFTY